MYRTNPLPGIKACIDYMKDPKNKPSLTSSKDNTKESSPYTKKKHGV